MKIYTDYRGWRFFVRPGLNGMFKAFYLKVGKTGGGHGCAVMRWRERQEDAEADLAAYAKEKGMREASTAEKEGVMEL